MRAIRLLSLFLFCSSAFAGTYTAITSGTENPLSEGNVWDNGLSVGLDWANIRKSGGLFFGTQSGNETHDNDSTAVLNNTAVGTWGSHQTVTATISRIGNDTASAEEIEIRVRTTITAHSCTGYEILFGRDGNGNYYMQWIRWNGALDDFTPLDSRVIPTPDGTVVKVDMNGSTITTFTNNVLCFTITDSTYTTGNPGMGTYFKLGSGSGSQSNYGFTTWTATDGQPNPSTTGTGFHGGTIAGGTIKTQ